jgi:chromatin remodeling complex protein RSC6
MSVQSKMQRSSSKQKEVKKNQKKSSPKISITESEPEPEVRKVEEKVTEVLVEQSEINENDQQHNVIEKIQNLIYLNTQESYRIKEERDQAMKFFKELNYELRNIMKVHNLELKTLHKKKKRTRTGNNSPSGINKPQIAPKEIRDFLGLKEQDLVSRTEVVKRISTYIKQNNLIDTNDRQSILPDQKLKKLLGEAKYPISKKNPKIGYGWFRLGTYINKYYPKKNISGSASS